MLKSKLHRVTCTASDLNYEGSCAIDEDLLDAADIREFQKIEVYNVNNGERFSTYAVAAQPGSGMVSVFGAAAHKASRGDILIIASYATYTEAEVARHKPVLVYVDGNNAITEKRGDITIRKAA
jgi:aspartate 1-decarboxylase